MPLVMAISYDQAVTVGFYLHAIAGKFLMERLPIRFRWQNVQKGIPVGLGIRFKGLLAGVGFNERGFLAQRPLFVLGSAIINHKAIFPLQFPA